MVEVLPVALPIPLEDITKLESATSESVRTPVELLVLVFLLLDDPLLVLESIDACIS